MISAGTAFPCVTKHLTMLRAGARASLGISEPRGPRLRGPPARTQRRNACATISYGGSSIDLQGCVGERFFVKKTHLSFD